ncbi:FAD-dependent monooxygenase [Streptomyces sp. HNM0574]|uniref:FAD-dependent monooxygenase n=1 Tax=Streptomyces sp. HNM0574 TaxID=2714954 RepID=UPI00146E99CF|nr:FAD-dependent monooxygenase [Streptomyces sp. HNM0574]NLU66792.1 pentachlorophenol monooxygenase [Streptomyces sp. HNM0574]
MSELNDVKERARVLVAGAGPTGLTLACDLARRGVPHLLIEAQDELFPGARGKGLQPRTLEVFDDLGLVDAVLAAGGRYPRVLDWEGAVRGETFDLVEPMPPRPGVPHHESLMLPQWRTQRLLLDRLRELGGDVRFGTRLTGLTPDAEGVTVRLTGPEGEFTVRAGYAVGADGGRSAVRKQLGIGMEGETVDPRPMIVADVRLTGLDREHWHAWRKAEGGGATLCPLRGTGDFQLQAQYDDPDARPDTSPEGIRALIGARTVLDAADVHEVLWASEFRARTALAERFRDGRVFLAGDAAHLHSPAGGQGLNTGIQDAYNLGWKLAAADGPQDPLLDTYEAERLPLAADVLGLSTRIHRATVAGRVLQRGRDTQQLDLHYRDSALTRQHGAPAGELRAGDRAPDARCTAPDGTVFRLFDAFRGPHCTLLTFGGAPPLPALPSYTRATGLRHCVVAATEPHAEGAYGTGTYLVRPDGYVAVAG